MAKEAIRDDIGDFTVEEIDTILETKIIKSSMMNRLARIDIDYASPEILMIINGLHAKEITVDYGEHVLDDMVTLISNTASTAAEDVGNTYVNLVPAFIEKIIEFVSDTAPDFLNDLIDPIYDYMLKTGFISAEFVAKFKEGMKGEGIGIPLFKVLLIVFSLPQILSGFLLSFMKMNEQENNIRFRTSLPDMGQLYNNYFKHPEYREMITDVLTRYGMKDEYIKMMYDGLDSMLDIPTIQNAFYRGELGEIDTKKAIERLGFQESESTVIKNLFALIPPVQDIIRIAVREGFDPEVIGAFKLHAEYPPELKEWGEKQGYSEYWTKALWAAHWVLPTPQMAFEMFHRDQLDRSELNQLLKAADFPQYLREKMLNISYNPLTRVDVRRMHRVGTLNESQVLTAYKHVGFSPENARLMTDFTVAYNEGDKLGLSKAQIIEGYRDDIINAHMAQVYLEVLGMQPEEAEYMLALEDYKEMSRIRKHKISNLEKEYKLGLVTRSEVGARLSEMEVPTNKQQVYIQEWDIERFAKMKTPTEKDLLAWYGAGFIDRAEWKEEMRLLGWNDRHIELKLRFLSRGK